MQEIRSAGYGAEVVEHLEVALDRTGAIVAVLDDEILRRPSHCDGWSIETLVGHIVAVTAKFNRFASGATAAPKQEPVPAGVDVRVAYAEAARKAQEFWRDPAAADVCELSFGWFDRWTAAGINAFDVIIHGWDLARSVDVSYVVDDASARLALAIAELLATPSARDGHQYGAPTPTGRRPSTFDAALALTGRDPRA